MTTVFAKVPFTYGGQPLERGQLVDLRGLPKDNQLLGLGYFVTFDPREHSKNSCLNCGMVFATEAFLMGHKRKQGGCLAEPPEITKEETAQLLGVDPEKVRVEA